MSDLSAAVDPDHFPGQRMCVDNSTAHLLEDRVLLPELLPQQRLWPGLSTLTTSFFIMYIVLYYIY